MNYLIVHLLVVFKSNDQIRTFHIIFQIFIGAINGSL